MKKSQLKQVIKENIKYILSESDNPTLEKIIIRFVKKYSKEWGLSMYDTFRGIQRKMEQMEDQFGEGKYSLDEGSKWLEDKDQNELASDKYARFNRSNTSYESGAEALAQKQFDDDVIDKKATKAAQSKKEDPIITTTDELQKLVKKMKDKAKEYKTAEGDKKESIKKELKKMTTEKKKLEASI
jgi:hypothetical protein